MFGFRLAGDAFALFSNFVSDWLATFGIFCPPFSDDFIIVDYDDNVDASSRAVLRGMRDAGLPPSERKWLGGDGEPESIKDVLGVRYDATVSIADDKRARSIVELRRLLDGDGAAPTRGDVACAVGRLRWYADVLPLLRPFAALLAREVPASTSRRDRTRVSLSPHGVVGCDAALELVHANRLHYFDQRPLPDTQPLVVWGDSCPAGVGIFLPNDVLGTPGRDVGYYAPTSSLVAGTDVDAASNNVWELTTAAAAAIVAVEAADAACLPLSSPVHVMCDNKTACGAFTAGRSRSRLQLTFLTAICLLQHRSRRRVVVVHVSGVLNGDSDALSRGTSTPRLAESDVGTVPSRLGAWWRRLLHSTGLRAVDDLLPAPAFAASSASAPRPSSLPSRTAASTSSTANSLSGSCTRSSAPPASQWDTSTRRTATPSSRTSCDPTPSAPTSTARSSPLHSSTTSPSRAQRAWTASCGSPSSSSEGARRAPSLPPLSDFSSAQPTTLRRQASTGCAQPCSSASPGCCESGSTPPRRRCGSTPTRTPASATCASTRLWAASAPTSRSDTARATSTTAERRSTTSQPTATTSTTSSPLCAAPQGADGRRCVTAAAVSDAVKAAAKAIGLDPSRFASHSLRIGGATRLVSLGVPFPLVKLRGGWASDVFLQYCRASLGTSLGLAEALSISNPRPYSATVAADREADANPLDAARFMFNVQGAIPVRGP